MKVLKLLFNRILNYLKNLSNSVIELIKFIIAPPNEPYIKKDKETKIPPKKRKK